MSSVLTSSESINKSQGAGVARILASQGNLAVALLARREEPLNQLKQSLSSQVPNSVFEAFPTDTTPESLGKTFAAIKDHQSFKGLKLHMAVFHVKHSSKKPFMSETFEDFTQSLETYVGGAFVFAQEALKRFFSDHGEQGLAETGEKKGVCIPHIAPMCNQSR